MGMSFLEYFFKQGAKVDIYTSDCEEEARYFNPPMSIHNNENKLRQWLLLNVSSKWEFLPRQPFMTKDKFE